MEITEITITLRELPIGSRLLVRSKKDWRTAVISKFDQEKAILIVCSPFGRTYRLHRTLETLIVMNGKIPLLKIETGENWRDNFAEYDLRW